MKSSKPFIEKYGKSLSPKLILLLLLFFCAILSFGLIIDEVLLEKENRFDFTVFQFIANHFISPRVTPVMVVITFFASATFLQIAYPALVLLYIFMKDWKRVFEIVAIGVGGFAVNYFMKLFFHRPRPDHPLIAPLNSFSFPSGHAMSGFIFYGLLAYLVYKSTINKQLKVFIAVLLILFSLLIGFSRIYLRLHYSSDVAAGFCVGFAWLLIAIAIMERQKKRAGAQITQ